MDVVFCRAFADDVGLVFKDRRSSLGGLAGLKKDFGDISGMQVNLSKTEGVLLAGEAMAEARKSCETIVRSGRRCRWAERRNIWAST